MQQQQQQPCTSRIEKWFIDLTNQLIKSYKLSNVAYLVIKILEYMQLTYFVMRMEISYHWNFSFVAYFSIFVNYTVVDSNIRLSSLIFAPLIYLIAISLLLVIILGILIGVQAGWGKKMPLFIKILIPILNIFLYFFKSILTIPTLQIIFICLSPKAVTSLGLAYDSIYLVFGSLILIFFLMVEIYIITFYRESNPFSDMQHAGQTVYRAVFIFFIKFLFSLYSILDLNGTMEGAADILYVIIIAITILQSHYEIGLYKHFSKVLQFKLMYLLLSIGFLQTLDFYSPYEITSFTFVLPYFLFVHLISDWILDWQQKRIVLLNLVLNDSPEKLEAHVLQLIYLIDSLELRSNRIMLEGYLHIHRRQCRSGPDCPCQNLGIVRERNEQLIKIEYFKLVVVILTESRRKYRHYHNIDLLLGLIYHFRIKNSLQAIYAFTKLVTSHKKNLINRLFVSYYLQRVEEDMKQLQEKEISRTSDINKYLEYTNKMVIFEEHVENCTKHHIEFWRLMLDSNPEIKRLEDLGTMITRDKDYLKEQFENIFEHNPNSIHLLTIYGKFLLEVTNEESYNVKYIEKAESILNNIKYSSKIDEAFSKYNENAQTGVIVINGSEGELGNIIHTNNLIKQLLGYRRNELLDQNVEMIMPKVYGDHHNAILNRYIAASESKVNGHERIVPALHKDGFILPANALTKALPTLTNGIQIVGFLAKMEQNFKEDEENQKCFNYMLYRSDNEQILGISEGCYQDYHIHPSLIYGNPYNMNNELKIKHLFGVSFERSEQGKIAVALEAGEVEMTINTKSLKDQFIISKATSKDDLAGIEDQQFDNQGVEIQIVARNVITTIYQGITLKLIALYPKKYAPSERNSSKRNISALFKSKSENKHNETKRQKIFEQATKTDSDDFKNLKDFKNFISIKSQPSAITAISAICLCFIFIISSSTIGLIANWYSAITINQNMMNLSQITLFSELSTPEMMTKTEKQIIGLSQAAWSINNFTPYAQSNKELFQIITSLKNWQKNILPYKYSFNPDYNDQTSEYSLLSSGQILKDSHLIEQVINNYISQLQTISVTNISSLQNFSANLKSNIYEKYSSVKLNELYSIRSALNSSNSNQWSWYKSSTLITSNIIIIVCSIMIGGIILWLVLLLPYVLSVTKINNRVLSLFSLIPYAEICKLIHGCMLFMNNNLSEANINLEDLKYYEAEQNAPSARMHQTQINSPSSVYSPSQLALMNDNSFTQSNMLRKVDEIGRGGDSVMMIEEKFEKMKNSEDRNKKVVITKFLLISLLILAFVLFYLFYSLIILTQMSTNLSNYQILGRRPALIRNSKLLIIEYLINPSYNPLATTATSIKNMNINIINEFYNLEANLLSLNLGSSQTTFNNYNNGDICSMIPSFSSYSIFNEQFSPSECYSVHSQILQKGVKTGIVDALESIRSLVSQYSSTVPRNALAANVLIFDILAKYIETPMLAVLSSINNNFNSTISTSRIIILITGGVFILGLILCWRVLWTRYLSELNIKIWRTKGLLNLIPMRIITTNDLLKNEFTSGQLENAVR